MTKKSIIEQCKYLLHKEVDTPLNEEERKWLWNEIYQYHPNRDYNYDDIVSITPKHNWDYGNKNIAFEFLTTDGSRDFWSYQKALSNRPKYTLI